MNQQEFDALCVELRSQCRQLLHNISNDRLIATHQLKLKQQQIQADKEKTIREYRDAIYDLATSTSPRSAAFVAGQAEARNRRDCALAELDAQSHKLEEEFFKKSQQLRNLADKTKHDFEMRRAGIIRQYNEWLEAHKAEKARQRQEGGSR